LAKTKNKSNSQVRFVVPYELIVFCEQHHRIICLNESGNRTPLELGVIASLVTFPVLFRFFLKGKRVLKNIKGINKVAYVGKDINLFLLPFNHLEDILGIQQSWINLVWL